MTIDLWQVVPFLFALGGACIALAFMLVMFVNRYVDVVEENSVLWRELAECADEIDRLESQNNA